MTAMRTMLIAALVSAGPAGAVCAQTGPARTEGDASATDKVPNTTAVGQTMPPSREASPTAVKPIERPTPEQVSDDAITNTVCVGCRPATTAADPLVLKIRPSDTPERRVVPLDTRDGQRAARLPTGEPTQQSDLDTVALASAHRERAESVQEKTTGLWQSWLVSVCDGCGDQKPAKALKVEDWPYRDAPVTTGSISHTAHPVAAHPDAKPPARRPRGTLEADLSPDNVDSIRRMPQQ